MWCVLSLGTALGSEAWREQARARGRVRHLETRVLREDTPWRTRRGSLPPPPCDVVPQTEGVEFKQ